MTESDRIKKFIEFMPTGFENTVPELQALGFFTAPASTKYHGAYHGGLFDHSLTVAENLVKMTKKLGLKWDRERSPYIVGMFHDICKCDNYRFDIETDKYICNPDIIIPGHGDKSIIMLSKNMDLTDEEIACIRWHMGGF